VFAAQFADGDLVQFGQDLAQDGFGDIAIAARERPQTLG
jgi:hypothetical protein